MNTMFVGHPNPQQPTPLDFMYVCMYVVRQLKASAAESPPGRTVSHPATPQEKPAPTQRYKRISVATSPATE